MPPFRHVGTGEIRVAFSSANFIRPDQWVQIPEPEPTPPATTPAEVAPANRWRSVTFDLEALSPVGTETGRLPQAELRDLQPAGGAQETIERFAQQLRRRERNILARQSFEDRDAPPQLNEPASDTDFPLPQTGDDDFPRDVDEEPVVEMTPGDMDQLLRNSGAAAVRGGFRVNSTGQIFFAEGGMWVSRSRHDMAKELDVSKIEPLERKLPPFKLEYSNFEEANLRLNESIIRVRSKPFYIEAVGEPERGHHRADWKLYLRDAKDKSSFIFYRHPDVDLRSIHPGYVHGGPLVSYFARQPARIYKQGITTATGIHKPIGTAGWQAFSGYRAILNSLEGRVQRKWDDKIFNHMQEGLIHGLYLSDNVGAVRDQKTGRLLVEYKGRILGPVTDDTVRVDPDDMDQSWIVSDLRKVGLVARV